MRRTATVTAVSLTLLAIAATWTYAQTSQPETASACLGAGGRLRLVKGGACPTNSTPVLVDLGPDAPVGAGALVTEAVTATATFVGEPVDGDYSASVVCPAGTEVTGGGSRLWAATRGRTRSTR